MTGPGRTDVLFEHLVDSISDHALYMLDPDGRVASWNIGARRMKGYTQSEIVGQAYTRFFTPEDRRSGKPQAILRRAAIDGRVAVEGWRLRKDGSRFWITGAVHAIRADDGSLLGFAKITRDMSASRAAQDALVESERRFRLLVEGVIDYSIFMLDADGVVANWNQGAERIKGWSSDEVVGRHFSVFYTPEDRRAGLPARALETALRDGRYEAEGWRVRKDGSRFWASVVIDAIRDEAGEFVGFAKITRDVSQKRAAEQALADSERQFRMLVSGVVDYALYMLDPNGVIASWNAGAQNIKGYAADEIVGQHFSRFYTEGERAAGVPSRVLQIAREKGRYEAEGWRVRKDGSLFWALAVIDAIRDENGQLIGFAKITRDMTERRDAQLELQKANERLAQAQKMEALGNLTGGVAHDFNNLLMVVSGQAQLLRSRVAEDPRAMRALDAIETAAQRGSALTRHLLTFARRQRLEPVAIDLTERVEMLRELLSASLPAHVRLRFDIAPDVATIAADVSEFELALLNLAVNARDAMPDGGSLTLRAENVELDGSENAHGLTGPFVAISMSDSGSGIPPDILPRIFDPFFTTKGVDKGTGLGLSQVFGFARQSGGWVDVASSLQEGSTFTLYLPRSDGAAEPVAADERAPAAVSASILLVEDNPEVADVAGAMLEQLGHVVRTVGSADSALAVIEGDDPPDLVFSDIVMAGDLSGLDLGRTVRERHPEIPILLATGYSQAAQQNAGEFAILRKPYMLAELSQAIAAALVRRHASDEKLIDLQSVRRARRQDGDATKNAGKTRAGAFPASDPTAGGNEPKEPGRGEETT